jgi:hypothetical protein
MKRSPAVVMMPHALEIPDGQGSRVEVAAHDLWRRE